MNGQLTAIEAIEKVRESFDSTRPKRFDFPKAASHLDFWRQGDVYITKLDAMPKGCKAIPFKEQLVDGTSEGSRHCLSGPEVKMYQRSDATGLHGPIFHATDAHVITHPRHGHVGLCKSIFEITYARSASSELKRRQD